MGSEGEPQLLVLALEILVFLVHFCCFSACAFLVCAGLVEFCFACLACSSVCSHALALVLAFLFRTDALFLDSG